MAATPASIRVALWSVRLGHAGSNMDAWLAAVDAGMAEAAARGARVLVMPEWIAKQWLAFAPANLATREEVAWLAAQAPAALDGLRPLPGKHGVALLAGSMPVYDGTLSPPWLNRAHLLLPDGNVIEHDKLCLTPSERDPDDWHLSSGSRVRVFDLDGVRTAMLICLDVELPALSARLAAADIDMLLVPSYTSRLSGYSRVYACARARAIELLTTVCVVGCFGELHTANASTFVSTSGAAVYVPCEPELGMRGVVDELPPRDSGDGPGPILVVDVPVGVVRALRAGAHGEVWPGAWSADHVRIDD